MDVTEIVKKLIGPIEPAGETHTDECRLKNLKTMCELVNRLVYDIHYVKVTTSGDARYSVKKAHEQADKFLKDLEDAIS